jgi:hypothetical protein
MKQGVEERGRGRGLGVLAAVAVLAAASVVAGLVRSSSATAIAGSLEGEQKALEALAAKLAEYKSLRKYDLKPKEQSRYVKRLMVDVTRRLDMVAAMRATRDTELERTKEYVRMKYGVVLKEVTLDKVVKFLYEIQYAGRNLVPMEGSFKRSKGTGAWNGSVGIHGVSTLK